MSEKICKHCNETKQTENFGKDAKAKDGLKSWCRQCFTNYQKERRSSPPPEVRNVTSTPITHKTCSCCKTNKEVVMFGGSSQTHDRYKPWCKCCNTTYMKQYRNTHPELREKERIYAKTLYSNQRNNFQTPNIILSN
jgi:hypothetical protein